MKIFMFVNYTPSDKSLGITKKISSEISAFRRLGHEVIYTAYGEGGIYIYDDNDQIVYKKKYLTSIYTLVRYQRYFLLIQTAKEYCDSTKQQFDIFYGRLLAPSKQYINLLRSFKHNQSRVILEAHAYFPGIRFQSMKGKYVSYMLDKNGPLLKDCVDKILTEGHIDDFYGIPDVCEARIGVETKAIKAHNYVGNKDELNMISVANETTYHAYDRIIKSLAEYYRDEDTIHPIFLHLVGTVSDSTKRLVDELNMSDKVKLYGKQYGEALDNIYNHCNLGLGPFGQHRIGGKKDTGLKTKEYFAKGLPYIFSGEEPTVPCDYPFILQFPSDESLIDLQKAWNFYLSYRSNDKVVQKMRDFALANYSWDAIMEEALK